MLIEQAANYTLGRLKAIRLVVVHTMESPEGATTARSVASYFAHQQKSSAGSSAHFCIDAAEVVQCVDLTDTAWAAPGANSDGVQLEHAGMAGQTEAQWADDYSTAVLARSAALAATIARAHQIPVRHLTDAELAAGAAGFVGHDQVSRVYRRSDHTDPGPHFPWARYMQFVAAGGAPTTTQEVAVPLDKNDLNAVSVEVWGPGSDMRVRIDPNLNVKGDAPLADGSPALSPITALRWAMEAAMSASSQVAALQQQTAALQQEVKALRAEVAAAGKAPIDPAALARAVRAEFTAHPLT